MAEVANATSGGFIRLCDLTLRIPVSNSTIYQWVQDGTFPAPVKLSHGVTAWIVAEIEQWEAEKCALRKQDDADARMWRANLRRDRHA